MSSQYKNRFFSLSSRRSTFCLMLKYSCSFQAPDPAQSKTEKLLWASRGFCRSHRSSSCCFLPSKRNGEWWYRGSPTCSNSLIPFQTKPSAFTFLDCWLWYSIHLTKRVFFPTPVSAWINKGLFSSACYFGNSSRLWMALNPLRPWIILGFSHFPSKYYGEVFGQPFFDFHEVLLESFGVSSCQSSQSPFSLWELTKKALLVLVILHYDLGCAASFINVNHGFPFGIKGKGKLEVQVGNEKSGGMGYSTYCVYSSSPWLPSWMARRACRSRLFLILFIRLFETFEL